MKTIETWVNNVLTYPPAEIYLGAPAKLKKQEELVKAICEDFYKFNWEKEKFKNPVSQLREVSREMQVLDNFYEGESYVPKVSTVVDLAAKFIAVAEGVSKILGKMHKKHPVLTKYYEGIEIPVPSLVQAITDWGSEILSVDRAVFDSELKNKMRIKK